VFGRSRLVLLAPLSDAVRIPDLRIQARHRTFVDDLRRRRDLDDVLQFVRDDCGDSREQVVALDVDAHVARRASRNGKARPPAQARRREPLARQVHDDVGLLDPFNESAKGGRAFRAGVEHLRQHGTFRSHVRDIAGACRRSAAADQNEDQSRNESSCTHCHVFRQSNGDTIWTACCVIATATRFASKFRVNRR